MLSDLPPLKKRLSRRAKYLQIKITPKHGIEVVIPARLPRHVDVDAFIHSKRAFILQHAHLAEPKAQSPLPARLELKYFPQTWQVEYQAMRGTAKLISQPNHRLTLLGNNKATQYTLLIRWLKNQAKASFREHLDMLSQQTDLPYQSLSIRCQKTRWGSCSADKAISLNMHLLFLPWPVVNYVLIHELAHTVHLDHSPAFWMLVKQHDPHYRQHQQQLKQLASHLPDWLTTNYG